MNYDQRRAPLRGCRTSARTKESLREIRITLIQALRDRKQDLSPDSDRPQQSDAGDYTAGWRGDKRYARPGVVCSGVLKDQR